MNIFLLTFGFFIVMFLAMAIGYIIQQKTLAGSCGGLGSIGIDKACNCDNPCEKRKERERKAALNEQSIDVRNI
ncbi:(Na+)-NQR maturation NqrM [Thalassotalea psychrophila]|uniref:(Na+)-NQR maturation NqrM n=1 Tax=Thalassotalea psychrophila TaxID=3065647 RepID=A0ABY9TX88_9GAMM|nr:(Na+)-NQR maturation NqrM [Colwelliaceae bacterium SQ149]